MSSIILASQSPRRRELMARITTDFEVMVSQVDEILPDGISPEDTAAYLAEFKASAVAADHPDKTVIGSDTVVILDGEVLGKPEDAEDAVRMLKALSDKTHTVITGCCIIKDGEKVTFSEATKVVFYPLSDSDIAKYIATGEPFDKAGAYGIQGQGSLLVKGIEGDFFNVVGFPVGRLNRELRNLSVI